MCVQSDEPLGHLHEAVRLNASSWPTTACCCQRTASSRPCHVLCRVSSNISIVPQPSVREWRRRSYTERESCSNSLTLKSWHLGYVQDVDMRIMRLRGQFVGARCLSFKLPVFRPQSAGPLNRHPYLVPRCLVQLRNCRSNPVIYNGKHLSLVSPPAQFDRLFHSRRPLRLVFCVTPRARHSFHSIAIAVSAPSRLAPSSARRCRRVLK